MPSRYQKEIEEILEQTEGKPRRPAAPQRPKQPRPRRDWKPRFGRSLGGPFPWLSPGKLMLGSLGILLVAGLLNAFNAAGAGLVFWAGLALFIVSYALFFIMPPKPGVQPRWRGRPVDYGQRSWRERLRRWFRTR